MATLNKTAKKTRGKARSRGTTKKAANKRAVKKKAKKKKAKKKAAKKKKAKKNTAKTAKKNTNKAKKTKGKKAKRTATAARRSKKGSRKISAASKRAANTAGMRTTENGLRTLAEKNPSEKVRQAAGEALRDAETTAADLKHENREIFRKVPQLQEASQSDHAGGERKHGHVVVTSEHVEERPREADREKQGLQLQECAVLDRVAEIRESPVPKRDRVVVTNEHVEERPGEAERFSQIHDDPVRPPSEVTEAGSDTHSAPGRSSPSTLMTFLTEKMAPVMGFLRRIRSRSRNSSEV